ncbi:GNAT family N-acetyltransferase [Actinomycetes bacterium KLBMP 9797]
MAVRAERLHARPRAKEQLDRVLAGDWPEFIFHDRVADRYLGRIRALFADLELVLVSGGDELVAAGWAVPLRWSGEVAELPDGYHDCLARAVREHDAGDRPDTLAILAAQVRPDQRGRGLAGELLRAFHPVAEELGCERIICPVRPTRKDRYPLTPIERYLTWTRPDGAPFDPWLRTHVRLGARLLAPAPRSQVLTGTVADWETWTGMAFPDSGEYIIPGGLSALAIDRPADHGVYIEPNVWLQHR